ncbi:MAG: hypothetical protein IKO35_06485 [Elusimicrobiaceae bacterium]|nr:hypothetical protein [Elusimicrobiaceae bacterium]
MKKLFLTAGLACLMGLVTSPVFAQNAQSQLNRYVTSQLTADEKATIAQLPSESEAELSEEEIRSILEKIISDNACPWPEVAQDLTNYITESAVFGATGQLTDWELKRSELYSYVQSSNWRTGKNISDADRSFRKTLRTIAFGLVKEAAQLCGWDRILDRLEQEAINKYENNETIQNTVAAVTANISDAVNSEDHTIESLYKDVQHNAFTLLSLNHVDYQKLKKAYPEVEYLFEDLYTFFKWRYELREADSSYKLNENNINVEFRLASSTNSFFAFWELANVAKSEMKNAVSNNSSTLTTLTVSDERDNMQLLASRAKQALYFGRVWNGMERYAVKRNILPKTLDPEHGARKASIKKAIKISFDPLSDEEILNILTDIRSHYASARSISEKHWGKWASEKLAQQKRRQIQKKLKALLQQQGSADSVKLNSGEQATYSTTKE